MTIEQQVYIDALRIALNEALEQVAAAHFELLRAGLGDAIEARQAAFAAACAADDLAAALLVLETVAACEGEDNG